MRKDTEIQEIVDKAKRLLSSGQFGTPAARKTGHVQMPIAVLGPNRDLHSWFVPITSGDLLLGFFEFLPDLTVVRFSSFQRHEDKLEGCPRAELWTNTTTIQQQLEGKMLPGEKIREVSLTYYRTPTRLAWRAILESANGTTRSFYITGNSVWEELPTAGNQNSFGGRSVSE